MKFQVYPCDDGRYFIVDTVDDLVVCYAGNSALATTVVDRMNEIKRGEAANDECALDPTKMH